MWRTVVIVKLMNCERTNNPQTVTGFTIYLNVCFYIHFYLLLSLWLFDSFECLSHNSFNIAQLGQIQYYRLFSWRVHFSLIFSRLREREENWHLDLIGWCWCDLWPGGHQDWNVCWNWSVINIALETAKLTTYPRIPGFFQGKDVIITAESRLFCFLYHQRFSLVWSCSWVCLVSSSTDLFTFVCSFEFCLLMFDIPGSVSFINVFVDVF